MRCFLLLFDSVSRVFPRTRFSVLSVYSSTHFIWQIYWTEFRVNFQLQCILDCQRYTNRANRKHGISRGKYIRSIHILCLCFIALTIVLSNSVNLYSHDRNGYLNMNLQHTLDTHLSQIERDTPWHRWLKLTACLFVRVKPFCMTFSISSILFLFLSKSFVTVHEGKLCGTQSNKTLFMAYIPLRLPTEPFQTQCLCYCFKISPIVKLSDEDLTHNPFTNQNDLLLVCV